MQVSVLSQIAMCIKPQPVVEQLTIWTLLDRINAEPLDANIIDLSNWIGALDLESAGDALVNWGISYRDRAIQLLNEWRLKSPLIPAELVEPFYDRSIFDSLVLGRMDWDLGDLVETVEVNYPAERQAVPTIAPVSKNAALELADFQAALDTAHNENVTEWGAAISIRLNKQEGSISLLELQRSIEMPLVQVWLGLLLNGFEIEQHGDFYETAQIWILPLNRV